MSESFTAAVSVEAPVVDGYALLEQIGEGGMGTVWRAHQLATNRQVAIKFLRYAFGDSPRQLARFQREIEITSRLEHPNIASVYDTGLSRGYIYYSMQLVEGVPVNQYFLENTRTLPELLAIYSAICRAVDYAHRHGVIHRDLKPANILVTPEGRPFVLDFGLARGIESSSVSTSHAGDVIGTLQYMAPEQAAGRGLDVTTRSDVFSLGLILWELLAGRPPRASDTPQAALLHQVINHEVPPLRSSGKRLSSDLEAITSKAVSLQAEARYASAGELADDIDRCLRGEPVAATPLTIGYFLKKKLRKHRRVTAAVTVAAAALLSMGLYSVVRIQEAQHRAETQLYYNCISWADSERLRGDLNKAVSLLDSCPVNLRHWEWRYLTAALDESLATLYRGEPAASMAVDEGAGSVTILDPRGQVWRGDARALQAMAPLSGPAIQPGGSVQLSNDGRFAARIENFSVILEDTQTHQCSTVAFEENARIISMTVDSQLRRVGVVLVDGRVVIRDRLGGGTFVLRREPAPSLIRLSHDGEKLLVIGREVELWNLTSEKATKIRTDSRVWVGVFSSDDRFLVLHHENNGLTIHDVTTSKSSFMLYPRSNDTLICSALDRTGVRMMCGWQSGRVSLWNLLKRHEDVVLTGHRGAVRNLAWLNDDLVVSTSADGTVRAWKPSSPPERQVVLKSPDVFLRSALNEDGTRIAWADQYNAIRVFDSETKRERLVLANGHAAIQALAIDGSGNRVASLDDELVARVWSPDKGTIFEEPTSRIDEIGLSPDGTRLVLSSWKQARRIAVWSLGVNTSPIEIPGGPPIAWSRDSRLLCTVEREAQGSVDGLHQLIVFDTQQRRPVARLSNLKSDLSCLTFTNDSKSILAATTAGKLFLWHVGDAKPSWEALAKSDEEIQAVAFNHDGSRLVVASSSLELWDPLAGRPILALGSGNSLYFSVRFSLNGTRLVASTRDTVFAWSSNARP